MTQLFKYMKINGLKNINNNYNIFIIDFDINNKY